MTESKRFKEFMPPLLQHEGGFVNNKLDPGGATKYGISLRFLKQQLKDSDGDGWPDGDVNHDRKIDVNDIISLAPDTVNPFYKSQFYDYMNLESVEDSLLAFQLFDFGVNAGCYRAVLMLQKLIMPGNLWTGRLLEKTLQAVNAYPERDHLCKVYHDQRVLYYQLLVKNKPDFEVFEAGWIHRADSCLTLKFSV